MLSRPLLEHFDCRREQAVGTRRRDACRDLETRLCYIDIGVDTHLNKHLEETGYSILGRCSEM